MSLRIVSSQSRGTAAENKKAVTSYSPQRRLKRMKTKLTAMLLTLTGLIILAGQLNAGSSAAVVDDNVNPHYKGGSSFNLVRAAPNVARCGAFPQNIELSFEGSGIDTEGGYNPAVFSACTDTTTN